MYIHRRLEGELKASLFQGKVVIVYGARQVGKTTLVKKIVEDRGEPYGYLNCDELDVLDRLRRAETSEALGQIVGGYKLVVIDEAQRVKNIGLKLKLLVDNFPDKQIIATDPNQFIMLKYYLPDNMDKNVRLYNAQNPSNDFIYVCICSQLVKRGNCSMR